MDSSGNKVRAYRSGDLGCYNADGTLDFRGRVDDQVKINGLRIELGEIKNVLQSHPQVAGAEVLVAERDGKKRLEAFVVRRSGMDLDERVLHKFLIQRIPGNWLPSSIRLIASLPLNPNGKVDRRKLLESIPSASGFLDFDDEPSDFLEKEIWSLWRDMLPGTRVGRHDHFFDLGGDSLSAMNMMAQVEKMIGRPLGLRSLLEGGTIADIAAAARETGTVSPPPLMICMQAGDSKPPFFFAHGDFENGGLYCQRIVHRLDMDQPFYTLAPHGTFGGELLPDLEEAAVSYVELIRSVQPKGPYFLGGFCNGAVVMYEAAQQLIRAGETVGALVLLDPPGLYLFLLRRRITGLGRLVGLPEPQCRAAFQRIAEGIVIWQYQGLLCLLSDFRDRFSSWTLKILRRLFAFPKTAPTPSAPKLNFHYVEILANYEPQAYLGANPVWIILRQGERQRPEQISYWSGFIPDLHIEVIPGTHMELRTPHMGEVAKIIKTALSGAA